MKGGDACSGPALFSFASNRLSQYGRARRLGVAVLPVPFGCAAKKKGAAGGRPLVSLEHFTLLLLRVTLVFVHLRGLRAGLAPRFGNFRSWRLLLDDFGVLRQRLEDGVYHLVHGGGG